MIHMICALVKREVRLICRSALLFLDRSFSRAMGCFFGCFRVRDHRAPRSPPPHLLSNTPPGVVDSKNRLSSLFLSEGKEKVREDSTYRDEENLLSESPIITKELRDEAKFLKACGTLPETPVEIRKAAAEFKDSPSFDKDSEFHSWLPNASIQKLQLDIQVDETPTPIKHFEQWERGSISSERTPSSYISHVQNSGAICTASTEDSEAGSVKTVNQDHVNQSRNIAYSNPSAANVQGRSKLVRFECNPDTCSSKGSSSEDSHQRGWKFNSPLDLSVSKPSPRPTPLKLSDEMQTPGTVFPANVEASAAGKNRVRSQYVYSVLNPVENISQWKVLKEVNPNSHQMSEEVRKTLEQSEAKLELGVKETSPTKDLNVEASLCSSVQPQLSSHDQDNPNLETSSSKKFPFGRTPGDRPIIGMVAAHWNENEPSHISPKWWDGNGIPNSTNKYKEDQKVSWHATPFEERLEKALSDETFISQRNDINGRPLDFHEYDDSDTALSKLDSSARSKSVVSF